jgi:hypothetical protein
MWERVMSQLRPEEWIQFRDEETATTFAKGFEQGYDGSVEGFRPDSRDYEWLHR